VNQLPEIAVGDARDLGVCIRSGDVVFKPLDEVHHLRQWLPLELCHVLLSPPPHLHPPLLVLICAPWI